MAALEHRVKSDLLSDLVWQYPLHPTTFAACPNCGDSMGGRGGWYCRECIKGELLKRGVDKNRLSDLIQRLVRAQTLQQEIRDLTRKLEV